MRKAVVFGAGSIGRGFLGPLLVAAGWKVTFIDVAESLVDRLNADRGYDQIIVEDDDERVVRVAPIDALLLTDVEAVGRAVTGADLIATAVGPGNWGSVAKSLADALSARESSHGSPMNVLLCENLHDVPRVVRELIADRVGKDSASNVGLIETSIGRMVPTPDPESKDPMAIRVEPYSYLPYDASAVRGGLPDVPGLIAIEHGFAMFADRKLYVHNMGHCFLASLAVLRGYEYIWQAVEDLDLRWLVRSAMVETATSVATVHEVPIGPLFDHVDDLLVRFGNRNLADTVERVGRDPLRKMAPDDRVLGSYAFCRRAGVPPSYLSVAVAAGALRLSVEDGWDEARALKHLDQHLFEGEPDPQFRRLVHQQFHSLQEGIDVKLLLGMIDQSYLPNRIV